MSYRLKSLRASIDKMSSDQKIILYNYITNKGEKQSLSLSNRLFILKYKRLSEDDKKIIVNLLSQIKTKIVLNEFNNNNIEINPQTAGQPPIVQVTINPSQQIRIRKD